MEVLEPIPRKMKCWSSLSTEAAALATVPAELLVGALGAAVKAGSRGTLASAASAWLFSAPVGKRIPTGEQIKSTISEV